MSSSRPQPSAAHPSSRHLSEGGARQSGARRLQKLFMMGAAVCAALGFLSVAFVVVSELTGHHAPAWLVWPFMGLLPIAMLLLIGAVLAGIALRRHN